MSLNFPWLFPASSSWFSPRRRLPKLDLIPIWISDPRKVPVRGVLRGLFDGLALALKMVENLFQVLHAVIDLTRSRLIFDVLIGGHNRPH
jgi:hypothetical protein